MVACPASRALAAEWLALCGARNYTLLDDSPSPLLERRERERERALAVAAAAAAGAPAPPPPPPLPFVANRHDQSLWSVLRKARAAAVVVPDDGGSAGAPLQATRCRSGAERACWLAGLRAALWVTARDLVPGVEPAGARALRRECEDGGGAGVRRRVPAVTTPG